MTLSGLSSVVLTSIVTGAIGITVAWALRRHTTLSIRNLYIVATAVCALACGAAAAALWPVAAVLAPVATLAASASLMGRRWRLSDLGAGEELRRYEQDRRWIWQPPPHRRAGERVWIATQGEIVRDRTWPAHEPYVPMTRDDSARLPRRAGQHVAAFGATGSGKTTSVLRAAAGRTLTDGSALLWVDPKGDPPTETFLRRLAATTRRPFVLFDPHAADTDRWQPLWGDRPSEVVARLVAGIRTSEPYYADTLRQHVSLVATILHDAGYWPPSFLLLVEASQLRRFDRTIMLARRIRDTQPELWRRVSDHGEWVVSREGAKALSGGLVRLALVIGDAWRPVLTPRDVPDRDTPAGVSMPAAIRAGAIVLWRTHVDQMPDEANAITAVALADVHAAVPETDGAPWTLVLDEFGAVVSTCADQALALLQRGRTHNGQVFVITQSTADVEALTGQTGLLDSLSDNFAAFVVHRQTSPDSRDWLAKLMGTTALWQSTDQTTGHGLSATGLGSRRRVREFRIGSDTFADLQTGEAVIHTTHTNPTRVHVDALQLPARHPWRIGDGPQDACEIAIDASTELPAARRGKPARATSQAKPSTRIAAQRTGTVSPVPADAAPAAQLDADKRVDDGSSDVDLDEI
ncbi:MAG: TraM recognition domain-containing protein [Solirubrobacteraceae bacterium]